MDHDKGNRQQADNGNGIKYAELDAATLQFVRIHRKDDVRKLALQASKNTNINMPAALEQIEGWQLAQQKLPSWAARDGLLYPPRLSMEQCSGEQAAQYKVQIVRRLLSERGSKNPNRLVDLTGGFGVDFSFLAPCFSEAIYVERQQRLCDVALHNFPLLSLQHAGVVCGDGTAYLHDMPKATMIYLDPARRNAQGAKVYGISDCEPDVSQLADELVDKADIVMIKLSPMLDWHEAMAELRHVREVHIVAVHGECKELLLVMEKDALLSPMVYCVNDSQTFAIRADKASCIPPAPFAAPETGMMLYEPNAATMKSGFFEALEQQYGVQAIGPNSHLFVSKTVAVHFPGRVFRILGVSSFNKKELRRCLQGIDQANIAVRNFPLSADKLRSRLKLRDGGDNYLFATTTASRQHLLLICKKE